MGTSQCQQCNSNDTDIVMTKYSNFQTIAEITEKFKIYAEDNMIALFSGRMQVCIERLYTLGQKHVSDVLINLNFEKKYVLLEKMIEDIENINLEELDHLSLIQLLPVNVQKIYNTQSKVYYGDEEMYIQDQVNQTRKSTIKMSLNPGLKVINKYSLKSNNNLQNISNLIKNNGYCIIATVGCFETQDVLVPLNIPTRKSLLRLFVEKLQATNLKYDANILVIFIVNPEVEYKFDNELGLYMNQLKQYYKQTEDFLAPSFKYEKILYRPCYPCVNLERKIQLINDQKIMFNYQNGDLIGFLTKHPIIQNLMQKYQYIQIANISNILEAVADRQILNYMESNPQIDIIANVISNDEVKPIRQTLKIINHFVEKANFNIHGKQKKCIKLTDTFYIRSSLLNNKQSHFLKLISTRIKSQREKNSQNIVSFYRTFEDILYGSLTVEMLVSKNHYSQPQRQEINFSNYCKNILGMDDTTQQQFVEICPQMLYGSKKSLELIIQTLSKQQSVGFPLVINRQKLNIVKVEKPKYTINK